MDKSNPGTVFADISLYSYGHTSLYTWMRNHITEKVISKDTSFFSLSLFREDGYNLSYDIYKDTPTQVEYFNRKSSSRVEEAIVAIKNARMHERILLCSRRVGKEMTGVPFDDTELFLVMRFDDREYMHAVHGKRVKQIIAIESINLDYLPDYINHFTLSSRIFEIVRNTALRSIITLDHLDAEKYHLLKEKLGSDPEVRSLEYTLKLLRDLNLIFTAISDTHRNILKHLPFLGQPNYQITPEGRLKIYLKKSSSESLGNGNAIGFYLDTVNTITES